VLHGQFCGNIFNKSLKLLHFGHLHFIAHIMKHNTQYTHTYTKQEDLYTYKTQTNKYSKSTI